MVLFAPLAGRAPYATVPSVVSIIEMTTEAEAVPQIFVAYAVPLPTCAFVTPLMEPNVVSYPVQLVDWYPIVTVPPPGTEMQALLPYPDCVFCWAWAFEVPESFKAVL